MSILRTRPIADSISVLERYIQQSEQAGGALTALVAGTVQGTPFNLVTFEFEPEVLPLLTLEKLSLPIDTDEQQSAVQDELLASGLTPLFFAPIFDSNQQVNIAACRAGTVNGIILTGSQLGPNPQLAPAAGATPTSSEIFSTGGSHGSFRGSSSNTSGLQGVRTVFSDGTVVTQAQETLKAIRGQTNYGSKVVSQRRIQQGNVHTVQQPNYCWENRVLPDAFLEENSGGFPSDIQVVGGKATQFGKKDSEDEGTGSELLKVVQTNSDVFGASLKSSRLVTTFGAPLKNSAQLLTALVEIYNPKSRRFARVPIVDLGPSESLAAQIDLTLALDQFLQTDGDALVQFRVVV
jgi:hypothetical protein